MLIFALCHCQLPFALCLSGKAGPDFRSRLYQIWHTADFTLFTNFLEGFGYFGTGCSAWLHVFGKLFHVGLELVNATIWSSVLCFFYKTNLKSLSVLGEALGSLGLSSTANQPRCRSRTWKRTILKKACMRKEEQDAAQQCLKVITVCTFF